MGLKVAGNGRPPGPPLEAKGLRVLKGKGAITVRDYCQHRLVSCLALLLFVGLAIGNVSPSPAQQPTFSVKVMGTEPTPLNLILQPGAGATRPQMLQVARAVQRALHLSGFFAVSVLPPGQTGASSGSAGWSQKQAAIPVTIAMAQATANSRKIDIEVADGGVGRPNFRRQFVIDAGTNNDVGYNTADVIYEYFTQRPGYFASRILYVRTVQERGRRRYQIVSSDLFGEGAQVLVSSRSELSAPRLSPDQSSVVYAAIRNDRPQLFIKQVNGGVERAIFNDRAIRFSPDFDASGNLYYTKAVSGNSDIYRTSLSSRKEQRLTRGPSIETAPAGSDDGSALAYVSDASGRQRIVVRNMANGGTRVIGSSGFNYGSPRWSPDGKLVALSRQSRGTFSIAVVNMETGEEQLVSSSYFEEHPIWATNGRVLVYERAGRSGSSDTGLWHVDIDTNKVQRLPISGNPRDPSWIR
jgi:tol-pal system beta propeller repeat protein TolB